MSIERIELNHGNIHRVLKLEKHEESYVCEGCKDKGFGLRYQCKQGTQKFAYHKICACPREAIKNTLFRGYGIQFYWETEKQTHNRILCYACGKDVEGFHYRVTNKSESEIYYLHPICANLPHVRLDKEVQLFLENGKLCDECRKIVRGFHYRFTKRSGSESYYLHPNCVKERRDKEVELFSENEATSKCLWCRSESCQKHPTSWRYEDGENWCLHLACVREMIEQGCSGANVSSNNSDCSKDKYSSFESDGYWKTVELGLGFIVGLLTGDVTGAISSTIVSSAMRLLHGKT